MRHTAKDDFWPIIVLSIVHFVFTQYNSLSDFYAIVFIDFYFYYNYRLRLIIHLNCLLKAFILCSIHSRTWFSGLDSFIKIAIKGSLFN